MHSGEGRPSVHKRQCDRGVRSLRESTELYGTEYEGSCTPFLGPLNLVHCDLGGPHVQRQARPLVLNMVVFLQLPRTLCLLSSHFLFIGDCMKQPQEKVYKAVGRAVAGLSRFHHAAKPTELL